jgi:hypothetical protein
LREEEEVVVSNWKKVNMQMLCRCTAMEMTTENCFQNADADEQKRR